VQDETDRGETGQAPGAPPAGLVAFWQAQAPALFPPTAAWRALSGGQTNAVWHVSDGPRALVVKLYSAGAQTPLFANDPDAEEASLIALDGTGLAADRLAAALTPLGRSLVYAHLPGRPWTTGDDPVAVAEGLARLHAQPPTTALPILPFGPARLRDDTVAICETLGPEGAALLACLPVSITAPAEAQPVFIHGDPTAANTLLTPEGVRFIDWQCPGIGDPADDLAVFLSPAMQVVSGNAPLGGAQEARFLAGYAKAAIWGQDTVARYRAVAPLYHARMTAYALWRARRGDAIYARAAEAERARITAA